ncbi:phosphoserine phosphatase, chloroplastic-like [Coffea arabica]|uniref:Phosphoserine phosphatase, chloroplastic-like n=1 Tax=Coffea arabica TaxID=13443 RepID=A0ABM4VSX0_COFAR
MEGLISTQLNPIHTYSTHESYVFSPTFSLRIKTIAFGNKFVAMRNLKSHTSINASVQLLEVPKEGRFNKALPSKVCLDEGIDEHAEFCGAGKAVVEWTTRAMSGSIPFEDALAARFSV